MSDRELLELIARVLEEQLKLLLEIRDQLVPAPYYPAVAAGSSITVRS